MFRRFPLKRGVRSRELPMKMHSSSKHSWIGECSKRLALLCKHPKQANSLYIYTMSTFWTITYAGFQHPIWGCTSTSETAHVKVDITKLDAKRRLNKDATPGSSNVYLSTFWISASNRHRRYKDPKTKHDMKGFGLMSSLHPQAFLTTLTHPSVRRSCYMCYRLGGRNSKKNAIEPG